MKLNSKKNNSRIKVRNTRKKKRNTRKKKRNIRKKNINTRKKKRNTKRKKRNTKKKKRNTKVILGGMLEDHYDRRPKTIVWEMANGIYYNVDNGILNFEKKEETDIGPLLLLDLMDTVQGELLERFIIQQMELDTSENIFLAHLDELDPTGLLKRTFIDIYTNHGGIKFSVKFYKGFFSYKKMIIANYEVLNYINSFILELKGELLSEDNIYFLDQIKSEKKEEGEEEKIQLLHDTGEERLYVMNGVVLDTVKLNKSGETMWCHSGRYSDTFLLVKLHKGREYICARCSGQMNKTVDGGVFFKIDYLSAWPIGFNNGFKLFELMSNFNFLLTIDDPHVESFSFYKKIIIESKFFKNPNIFDEIVINGNIHDRIGMDGYPSHTVGYYYLYGVFTPYLKQHKDLIFDPFLPIMVKNDLWFSNIPYRMHYKGATHRYRDGSGLTYRKVLSENDELLFFISFEDFERDKRNLNFERMEATFRNLQLVDFRPEEIIESLLGCSNYAFLKSLGMGDKEFIKKMNILRKQLDKNICDMELTELKAAVSAIHPVLDEEPGPVGAAPAAPAGAALVGAPPEGEAVEGETEELEPSPEGEDE